MAAKKSRSGPVQVRSWKSIQQKVQRPPAATRRSRRRNFLFLAGAVFLSVFIIFGSYLVLFETERLFGKSTEFPLKEISFETDGTLPRGWLDARISLVEGTSLLQTDIYELRERLEAHPQVASCVVRRRFPDALDIRITEQKPVLRIVIREQSGRREAFVARDGTVFPGVGLDRASVRRMPFLTGVELVERPGGYAPIPGFRTVADLVTTAMSGYPGLYRTWRIVDLSLFDPDPAASFSAIRVRGTAFNEALFGSDDFSAQLLRLQDILMLARERGIEKLGRVDLRFDESVPTVLRGGNDS